MHTYQLSQGYSQPQQQSSKYIDPEKIFPKRLGTYQNGNALVLEYYNLTTDKFKKHLIPLDHSKSAKQNLDMIYKNPKHSLLLRKVQIKYVENVLKGQSVIGPSIVNSSYSQQNQRQSFSDPSSQSYTQTQSNTSYSQKPSTSYISSNNYQTSSQPEESSYTSSFVNNKDSYTQQDNSVSFIESKPSNGLSQQAKEKIQEVQDYYEQEFEDFQMSQSIGKKNAIPKPQPKKSSPADLSLNSNPVNQSISMPLQSKYNHTEQIQEKQEKKEKKPKKSKDKKSKKKKEKEEPESDQFDFDFLDDEGTQKKPAKAKDSSKEKTKTKEKSKQKKQDKEKTSKKQKVQEKPKIQPKPVVKEEVIEEDFDFDL